ncbi:hypothetical protein E8E11_010006 [Didymella keratinophila]|nr:hypothetical protein E8E11_010006 [Didymella keratinophila]
MTLPLSKAPPAQPDADAPDYQNMILSALKAEMRQHDITWRGHHKKKYFIEQLGHSDDQNRKAQRRIRKRASLMSASTYVEDTTRRSFLDLPTELRNMVYEHVFERSSSEPDRESYDVMADLLEMLGAMSIARLGIYSE